MQARAAAGATSLAHRVMTAAADPRPSTVRAAAVGVVGLRLPPPSADAPLVVGAHLVAAPPLQLYDWDREIAEAMGSAPTATAAGAPAGAGSAAPRAGGPGSGPAGGVSRAQPPLPPGWPAGAALSPALETAGGGHSGFAMAAGPAPAGLAISPYGIPPSPFPGAHGAHPGQAPPASGPATTSSGEHYAAGGSPAGGGATAAPVGVSPPPPVIHLHPGSIVWMSGPASVGATRTSRGGLLLAPAQQTRVSNAPPNYQGDRLVIDMPSPRMPPGARSLNAIKSVRDPALGVGNTADQVLHLLEDLLGDPGRFGRLRRKAVSQPLISTDAFYRSASYDSGGRY